TCKGLIGIPFSVLDAPSRPPMMHWSRPCAGTRRWRQSAAKKRWLSLCSAGNGVRERVLARTRSDKSLARFDRIALVLSGGGALGAYQAGAYAALENRGVRPNWIAGTAIGALNAAIIAGNLPHERVLKLRQFWQQLSRRAATRPISGMARSLKQFVRRCVAPLGATPRSGDGAVI